MFNRCSPIIPVTNIPEACAFLQDALGFDVSSMDERHAGLIRDEARLHLVQAGGDMDMSDPRRQQSCYIDVDDVDAVYAAHKATLDALPDGHFRAPFDQPYGMREFHVIYESLLIFVGQRIQKADAP